VAAAAILLGWIGALIVWVGTTLALFNATRSGWPPLFQNLLLGPLGSIFTFFLPGALGFAGMVTAIYNGLVSHYLPRPARGQWLAATFAGSVGYWFFAWLLLLPWRSNAIFGFAPLLGNVEGTVFADAPKGTLGLVIGMIAGSVSGAALGTLQWLVLRRYARHAAWWIVATIVGSVSFMAAFLYMISSALQSGGWN
jgi:hypothetical protein